MSQDDQSGRRALDIKLRRVISNAAAKLQSFLPFRDDLFLRYGFCSLLPPEWFARCAPSRPLTCMLITRPPEAFSSSPALCTVRTKNSAGRCFTVIRPCFCAYFGHLLLYRSGPSREFGPR